MKAAALCGTVTIDVYKTLIGLNFISLGHSSNALKFPFSWSFETWILVTLAVHQLAVLLVLPYPGSAVRAVRSGLSPCCSPIYTPHPLITLSMTCIMVFRDFHHICHVWHI